MGILDAPATDWRGKALASLSSARDLNAIAWYDASQLAGADGSAVSLLQDQSGFQQDVAQFASANQPTLGLAALSGLNVVNFGASSYLANANFGASAGWGQPSAGWTQPMTKIGLFKANSSGTGNRILMGGTLYMRLNAGRSFQGVGPSSNGLIGGPPLDDGAWHVYAAQYGPNFAKLFVDGYLVATDAAGAHNTTPGTADVTSGISLGGQTNGTSLLASGSFAEGGVIAGQVSDKRIAHITAKLQQKWAY